MIKSQNKTNHVIPIHQYSIVHVGRLHLPAAATLFNMKFTAKSVSAAAARHARCMAWIEDGVVAGLFWEPLRNAEWQSLPRAFAHANSCRS